MRTGRGAAREVWRNGCGYVAFGAGDFVEHEVDNFFFANAAKRLGIVDATDNRNQAIPC